MFCGECCVDSFGLEAAKFLERAVEGALRGGASAVNGELEPIEFFFSQILRWSNFEIGAAAEAPCGVDNFASEGLFERRVRREFREITGLELIKDALFFRADEVRDGKEPELGCVLGYPGFTFGRDRAMGPFGVLPIGQDLSGTGHGVCARDHS